MRCPRPAARRLSLAPRVEHGEGERVQRDDPPAGVALGLAGLDIPAELDELLGDGQRTRRAVEVGPPHAAGFPPWSRSPADADNDTSIDGFAACAFIA